MKRTYSLLIGPIVNMIIPLVLAGVMVYLMQGGLFDVADLADDNGTVRIPVVLLIVVFPIGYLFDTVGTEAGIVIVALILLLWFGLAVRTLIKRIQLLKH